MLSKIKCKLSMCPTSASPNFVEPCPSLSSCVATAWLGVSWRLTASETTNVIWEMEAICWHQSLAAGIAVNRDINPVPVLMGEDTSGVLSLKWPRFGSIYPALSVISTLGQIVTRFPMAGGCGATTRWWNCDRRNRQKMIPGRLSRWFPIRPTCHTMAARLIPADTWQFTLPSSG